MIGIVMTYYDRQFQLNNTLKSLENSNEDFFVVIVDDASPKNIELPIVDYDIDVLKVIDKRWVLGTPAWNIGIRFAINKGADVILLQNAECYHVGDVLKEANKVTNDNYLAFGCFSIDKKSTFNGTLNLTSRKASLDGDNAWYNHSKYRPVAFHFCTAITAENMKKINGFDERFSFGIGYDDNYLVHQVKMLGLKIDFVDEPFVVHQWHYSQPATEGKDALVLKNKVLYNQLVGEHIYKAKHLLTADL